VQAAPVWYVQVVVSSGHDLDALPLLVFAGHAIGDTCGLGNVHWHALVSTIGVWAVQFGAP
jgi:hypothetical protein